MSQLSASLLSLKPFYHEPASLSIRIKKGLHFCKPLCPQFSVMNGQPFPRAGLSGLMAYCQPL